MIPVVKGGEPKALTEAKRDIRNTPDAPFDYSSLQGESRAICARIACAELVPTIALQLSNI